jgi:hypothetical protein
MSLFENESVLLPLVGFNLGIEVGQLLIVALMLLATWLILSLHASIKQKHVTIGVSIIVLISSLYIIYDLIGD